MSFVATAIIGSGALTAGASLFASSQQQKGVQNAQNLQMQLLPIAESQIQGYTGQGVQSIKDLITQALGTQAGYVSSGVSGLGGMLDTAKSYLSSGVGALAPYAGGGGSALNSLLSLITPGGISQDVLAGTPGFQFTQNWGMRGINNAATTSGLGGNVLKAGADYSGGLASSTWQNLVSALQSTAGLGGSAAGSIASLLSGGANLFGNAGNSLLSTLSGAGNTAASLLGSAGASIGSLLGGAGSSISNLISGTGGNLSNLAIGGANAAAGGTMGAAGGLGSALSGLSNYMLLKNLIGGGGAVGTANSGAWTPNPATGQGIY